uniref:ER membrane protein complex subunit 2 n=2 Tax=Pelodiscus sinensis TaxID=13735 RepID=K7FEG3_PELSI
MYHKSSAPVHFSRPMHPCRSAVLSCYWAAPLSAQLWEAGTAWGTAPLPRTPIAAARAKGSPLGPPCPAWQRLTPAPSTPSRILPLAVPCLQLWDRSAQPLSCARLGQSPPYNGTTGCPLAAPGKSAASANITTRAQRRRACPERLAQKSVGRYVGKMAKVSELYDVTWEEMRDKMRKWREENYRNSEQIVEVGGELINEYASKLGDDIWIIYEQVMIAALDCSRDDLALFCLQELRRQFPGSHRVKRLTGMRFEYMERYDDAIQLYDRILQEDSTNTATRKRKIAIRKAQGKNVEAIRELNEYLEQFVGDQEAWHELAELYINEHDYAKAAFCLEELMMTNPHNHLYCQQFAEVKYTQGGLENLELARKYFAQALKLNNRNMRALFGLYMSASHIASNPKASAKMKKDNMKYATWAANQINRAYQFAGRSKKETKYSLKAVEDMLETLQITQS